MNNNISKFTTCANCGACYNACPKDAIRVIKDDILFKLSVDEDKCISCGKCVSVCPLNTFESHLDLRKAYGGWLNDPETVKLSSSGGAFSAIAEYVLNKNGIVYGAVFSDDRKEVIFRSTKEEDLDKIRRSKYVESQPQYTYRNIKSDLDTGVEVLFCGSPCQVAGLKRFLNNRYDNLITCDFACGGMASHKMYEDYLNTLEAKYHAKITSVNFRPKLYGWSLYSIKVDFTNGKSYRNVAMYDPYFYSFVYGRISIRENCLDCKFRENHYSDFVIADFWKWNTISELKNNERGISLIITNSDKGDTVLSEIKQKMTLVEIDLEEASYNCKVRPSPTKEYLAKREAFIKTYKDSGLVAAAISSGMRHGVVAKFWKAYTTFRIGKLKR